MADKRGGAGEPVAEQTRLPVDIGIESKAAATAVEGRRTACHAGGAGAAAAVSPGGNKVGRNQDACCRRGSF